MPDPFTTIPVIVFDDPLTPLDSYLFLLYDLERTRRQQQWYAYQQIRTAGYDAATLVEQLQQQLPTPHLDAVEARVN
jgi:hypothetical protein